LDEVKRKRTPRWKEKEIKMIKAMIFIDGSWLYRSQQIIRDKINDENLTIDYGKLPSVLAGHLSKSLGQDVDLVRTYFFASIPKNVAPQDISHVEDQRDFYNRLKEDFNYETEIYEIDFKKRRYFRAERSSQDTYVPKEKCVDIALASTMLYFSALPYGFDAAIPVIGDEDYVPALQHLRRMAKRVMIASIHGSCDRVYDPSIDSADSRRVRDVDTVFLDEILGELLLEYPLIQLECNSPLHEGDNPVWVREQPRKGRPYYCPHCRAQYARQRAQVSGMSDDQLEEIDDASLRSGYIPGRVSKKSERGFGFIRCREGEDWYFHATHLVEVDFTDIWEGQIIQFRPKTEPGPDNSFRGDVHEVTAL
jgi:cold shock CspA family protein/uncharacterized LabA/DUF88 family protein